MQRVRWGVLSTAEIGLKKVLPAMQQAEHVDLRALASRSAERAREAADALGIPRAFGAYEDLLADDEIDAIYNPLPNHLHVPWTMKAIEAGKHVLCEKPIAMNAEEAQQLLESAAEHPELKVMEAFMYRHHPQWVTTKDLVARGEIGDLRSIQAFFSYNNTDPADIRNRADTGGGGLMDIGCYPISVARFIFNSEPRRVAAWMQYDSTFGTDILGSAVLDFGDRVASFSYGTQTEPHQRVNIFGTAGRIEVEIPFNAPPDRPCVMKLQKDGVVQEISLDVADQYAIQGELMSRAILEDTPVPTPLEDAVANMKVIDRCFAAAREGSWS
jgi:predicted dehydrogenase